MNCCSLKARLYISIWRNIYTHKLTLACKRLIHSKLLAWLVQSTEIWGTPNLLLKCLRGKSQVSLSAHGTHSAYSRTPAGATGSGCVFTVCVCVCVCVCVLTTVCVHLDVLNAEHNSSFKFSSFKFYLSHTRL